MASRMDEGRPRRDGHGAGHGDDRLELVAPAKVNLALLVGPRRRDGYHEVFSLMLPVTLADTVAAERVAEGVTVECDVSPGDDNLAARAVRALEEWAGRELPVRLRIDKRVPHGAGLGGGSSDAAAALRAVDDLYDLRVPPPTLYRIAGTIGADVPFFLWPGPQIAMGRGNVLSAVELPGPLDLVLAVPDLVLPTPEVYGWRDEDTVAGLKELAAGAERLRSRVRLARRPADLAAVVGNDLERHVVTRRPVVGRLRERLLRAGALAAAMSGSGSSVFGLFAGPEEAAAAASDLRAWGVAGGSDLESGESPGSAAASPSRLRVYEVSDLQPLADAPG